MNELEESISELRRLRSLNCPENMSFVLYSLLNFLIEKYEKELNKQLKQVENEYKNIQELKEFDNQMSQQ